MSGQPFFPFLRKEAPLLTVFRQKTGSKAAKKSTASTLTPEEKALMEDFRRGMAEKLGVPPEQINDAVLEKWVVNWSRAFIKPAYWTQQGYARRLGQDLITIIFPRPPPPSSSQITPQQDRMPPRGSTNEQERRDRYYRSDLSVAK